MKPEIMEELNHSEREDEIMKLVLTSLKNLRGAANFKDLEHDLYEKSTTIFKEYIDYTIKSKLTGYEYRPFDFQFNFAIKNLVFADYINYLKFEEVELTEKGWETDLETFNAIKRVRLCSDFESKENKAKKVSAHVNGKSVAVIFLDRPEQWGLRGDPCLWDYLEVAFSTIYFPCSVSDFIRNFEMFFLDITQHPFKGESVFVENFSHGGMSSGVVSIEYWEKKALPLLVSRLEDLKNKNKLI